MRVRIKKIQDLRPKICLIGNIGVGRTAIIELLKSEENHVQHVPEITGDILTLKIGKKEFYIWDYTEQEQFSFIWQDFLKGSDAVLLITDSTLGNIDESKELLELIKQQISPDRIAVLCNKQDLEGAVKSSEIEEYLGCKSYPINALNPKSQKKIVEIIAKLLNISDEVTSILKALNERETSIIELEEALKVEDFKKAIQYYDKITDLCYQLGDNFIGNEYKERGKILKEILEKEERAQKAPTPAGTIGSQQILPQKPPSIENDMKTLLKNYINDIESIIAVSVSDRGGNIITFESKVEDISELGISTSTAKTLETTGLSDQAEKKYLNIICPICHGKKRMPIPKSIIEESSRVTTLSIPKELICEHHFQVFVDKNFAIRGYQRVDYEIDEKKEGYMDRIIKESGMKSKFCNIITSEDKKYVYCSQGPKSILTTVAELTTTDIELRVYSEHIAGKVELLLNEKERISLEIPEIVRVLSKTKSGKIPAGNYSTKLIITGDYHVGKTSLIKRFIDNTFEEDYQATVGVELSQKIIEISDETTFDFIVWDIGGQITQMTPYRSRFYNGAHAAFIVLDRSRPKTFEDVKMWYNDIKKSVQGDILIVIVGNKSDLENMLVSELEIKKLAQEFGFHYILTSAKTGENVNDAFLYIAYKFLETL